MHGTSRLTIVRCLGGTLTVELDHLLALLEDTDLTVTVMNSVTCSGTFPLNRCDE